MNNKRQTLLLVILVLISISCLLATEKLLSLACVFLLYFIVNGSVIFRLMHQHTSLYQSLRRYCYSALIISLSAWLYAVVTLFIPHQFAAWLMPLLAILTGMSVTTLLWLMSKNNQALIDAQSERYQTSLAQEIAAKQALSDELSDVQETLESSVQERTLELNIALQELEEVNRELAAKTTLDDLTGIYNRRFYDQKILAEYRRSRRNLSPLSLIVIDIDHFKKVNDNYGHIAGDECLKVVANIIKTAAHRSADIVCRYGGEEFCVILPETTSNGANQFAIELNKRVAAQPVNYQAEQINLRISCGVSTYQQQEGATPETIFSAADQALYQAKEQGRDRVVVADPVLLKRIEE